VFYNSTSKQTYSLLDSSHKGFRSIKGLKDEYMEQNTRNETKQEPNEENLLFNIIDEGKIAYVKINTFMFENIETDRIQLQDFFKKVSEYPHLIIDIQDNSGGSDKYWQELIVSQNLSKPTTSKHYFLLKQNNITSPFLKAYFDEGDIFPIAELPKFDKLKKDNLSLFSQYVIDEKTIYPSSSESLFKGKIWVLTSPKVYSSSENFVMFCKNTGFATLVGTQTGGDGGVADPILLSLPNSGLIIRFSMFYGLNEDGSGNEATGTLPNIMVKENENALDICISQLNR
jgi:C-terminal processing protease CtpA/Prc